MTIYNYKPFFTDAFNLSKSFSKKLSAPIMPEYMGSIGICIAAIFFGFCYVPVKYAKIGDGMFFQWLMASTIAIVGVLTQIILVGNTVFYTLGLLGGALWATGNVCTVPIFKTIGLSLGILLWSSFSMLIGWASSRFGWFGIKQFTPKISEMNYAGIGVALSSTIVYAFIEPTLANEEEIELLTRENRSEEEEEEEEEGEDIYPDPVLQSDLQELNNPPSSNYHCSSLTKKILGTGLAVFAGINYGLTFVPMLYIQENYPNVSQSGIEYVMSNFLGIYLASTVYFVIYAIFKRGKKIVPNSEMILPSLIAGVLWSIACVGWFVANEVLSSAITFPVVNTLPCIITSCLGIFAFKEIRGFRNYVLLCGAYSLTFIGIILTAFSR